MTKEELEEDYKTLLTSYNILKDNDKKIIKEMGEQIEKMKCCENCKYSDTECEGHTVCNKGHFFDCLSNKIFDHTTEEKDYWEIKEK